MHSKTATRRRHDDELKSRVLAECDEAWRVSRRGRALIRATFPGRHAASSALEPADDKCGAAVLPLRNATVADFI
jgi:hypothetical protein